MFQATSPKPLLGETVFQNFSLFSSNHEEKNRGGADDFFPTSKTPTFTPVLGSVGKASPSSGMIKTPWLLTPKQANLLNWNGSLDSISMMSDEFKNLELDCGAKPMTTLCANANPKSSFDSANIESSDSSCLFTSAKYFQAFGSEAKNEIKWNEAIDKTEDKSHEPTDIPFRAYSEGSSLSISLSRSVSISPLNEESQTALSDVQRTNLQTQSSSKNVHVKLGTNKNCIKSNNDDNYSRQSQRTTPGKLSRNNRWRRSWNDSNLRTSNNQKQSYGAKDRRALVSMRKQKNDNDKKKLGKASSCKTKNS